MNNKSDGAKQFLKFLGIGYLNALVYYLSYSMLVWLGVNYIVSNAVGRLVFKEDGSKEKRVWWRVLFKVFATNFFTGLLLTSLLLKFWLDIAWLPKGMEPASAALAQSGIEISARKLAEYVAPVINLCITTPLNFFINKFWTYRQKRKTTEG